ncbi:hypothetical protein C5Y41_09140 [Rahnella variigena]|nr:hypothetical protein C5Y41_09140 [Rahnella variigena]
MRRTIVSRKSSRRRSHPSKKQTTKNILHTSDRNGVGDVHSPESLTNVSSSGFVRLPPYCNPNYFGYFSNR